MRGCGESERVSRGVGAGEPGKAGDDDVKVVCDSTTERDKDRACRLRGPAPDGRMQPRLAEAPP